MYPSTTPERFQQAPFTINPEPPRRVRVRAPSACLLRGHKMRWRGGASLKAANKDSAGRASPYTVRFVVFL
uniref:Uncharacterized protein n=1 Tax=Anguilla anguilla TaxID=7936 RepID=A0A0E9QFP3_ANGAN